MGVALAQNDLTKMQQLAKSRYGDQGAATVGQWRALFDNSAGLTETEKVTQVNTFFNRRVRFVDDRIAWKQKDYWATPLETMGRLQGDCEDFSIAKYVTLQLMGIPISKMRITYVRARLGSPSSQLTQAHMVLSYYPQARAVPLILDNLIGEIRPASRRTDLTPVYGFNSEGLWLGGATNPAISNPSSRLSRWRDMLSRMQQEGLE
jgi:predicted transglutaminase-like cysteine proteinase